MPPHGSSADVCRLDLFALRCKNKPPWTESP